MDANSTRQVRVTLVSVEPDASVELHFRRADPKTSSPIVACRGTCSAVVRPGRYQLVVIGGKRFVTTRTIMRIDDDVTLYVDPDTKAHRYGGLTLGIAGTVALAIGGLLVLTNSGPNGDSSKTTIGAGLVLPGLIATPIGWALFGTSMRPEIEEVFGRPRAQASRWSVGLSPTKTGGFLGASLTF